MTRTSQIRAVSRELEKVEFISWGNTADVCRMMFFCFVFGFWKKQRRHEKKMKERYRQTDKPQHQTD